MQLLAIIDSKFPDAVMYDSTFVCLHLLVCRMLDGHNLSEKDSKDIREEAQPKGNRQPCIMNTGLHFNVGISQGSRLIVSMRFVLI